MKHDRYAAIVPNREQGKLLTKPFRMPGERVTLNTDAGKGEVRVRLLGADGKPLPSVVEATSSPIRFFFQAEDGIRAKLVTGVQTCALPISIGQRVDYNGRELRLSPAPILSGSTVMVPARATANAIGADIDHNGQTAWFTWRGKDRKSVV